MFFYVRGYLSHVCVGVCTWTTILRKHIPKAKIPHARLNTPPNKLKQTSSGPPASDGLKDATLAVASAAKAHLDEARSLAPRLPPGAAALLRPAIGVGEYLRALEAAGFDPFAPGLPEGGVGPLRRAVVTKWHALRGTY